MPDMEIEVGPSAIEADSVGELRELFEKFKSSVSQVCNAENVESEYDAGGVSELYNIVSTCMEQFLPKLQSTLQLPEPKDPTKVILPSMKNKRWKAIQTSVKAHLVVVLQALSNAGLRSSIGKHMPQLIAYYSCFPKLSKVAMEKMIGLWSSDADKTIAVSCINRLIRHIPPKQFEESITRMYAVFSKSCKVTTSKSLPLINIMKQSLVETMSIRPDLAYKCAFVSIKGMAKKLRNVSSGYQQEKKGSTKKQRIAAKKEIKDDGVAPISNWQHLHLTSFWIALICRLRSDAKMQTLVHHIVEIVNDTVRAKSSIQYYPLRFNCLRMLIELCEATELFIPVLPFLIDAVDCSAFRTKASQNSKTQYNFETTLKVLKNEVHEKAFVDEVLENCFALTLQYCVCFSHSVAFPELVQTTVQVIKKFVNNCPVPAYTSKMKTLVQKLEEQSNVVKRKRATASLDLHNAAAMQSWEQNFKQEKNALAVFFEASKKRRLEKKELVPSHEETIEAEVRISKHKEKQLKAKDESELEVEGDNGEDGVSADEGDEDDSCDDDHQCSFDEEEMEFENSTDSEEHA